MKVIKETTLHPEGNDGVDLYPKTNINQVEKLPQKLTYLETQVSQLNANKLAKPTNPSAESAVTMLPDGTVGTKPLSEISGGKLYLHYLQIVYSAHIYLTVYRPTSNEIVSIDNIAELSPETYMYGIYSDQGIPVTVVQRGASLFVHSIDGTSVDESVDIEIISLFDTVTEL